MSHGYDHILELQFEGKQNKLENIASEILRDNISISEIDDILWLWVNRKSIIKNKETIKRLFL